MPQLPFGLQHAPGTHGSGGQVVVPMITCPGAGHCPTGTMLHPPLGRQQTCSGQGLGWQLVTPTRKMALAGQAVGETTVHTPVIGLQQAPMHGFGTHTPPAGPQRPWQADCVVIVQVVAPCGQHGPTGGQGFG